MDLIENQNTRQGNTKRTLKDKRVRINRNMKAYEELETDVPDGDLVFDQVEKQSPDRPTNFGTGRKHTPSRMTFNITHQNNVINNFCSDIRSQKLESKIPNLKVNNTLYDIIL